MDKERFVTNHLLQVVSFVHDSWLAKSATIMSGSWHVSDGESDVFKMIEKQGALLLFLRWRFLT